MTRRSAWGRRAEPPQTGPMATGPEPARVADLRAGALMSQAAARLTDAGSETARLDAELLVSHAFARDRTWLHAHPDATLDEDGARDPRHGSSAAPQGCRSPISAASRSGSACELPPIRAR